jgi:hypothetical protein
MAIIGQNVVPLCVVEAMCPDFFGLPVVILEGIKNK